MHTASAAKQRFSTSNLDGASAPRIIVMCFDRLDRDLTTAIATIERREYFEANNALGHAQDLLTEMALMVDTSAWEHAGSLLAIYDYLLRLLAIANAKKDVGMVREAMRHLGEIGAAFRQAERGLASAARPPGPLPAAHPAESAEPRRISVRA